MSSNDDKCRFCGHVGLSFSRDINDVGYYCEECGIFENDDHISQEGKMVFNGRYSEESIAITRTISNMVDKLLKTRTTDIIADIRALIPTGLTWVNVLEEIECKYGEGNKHG